MAAFLVGVKGLEPPTSCSQSRRATSCATPRSYLKCGWSCGQTCGQNVFLTSVREVELSLKARLYATFRRSWKAAGATGYTLPKRTRKLHELPPYQRQLYYISSFSICQPYFGAYFSADIFLNISFGLFRQSAQLYFSASAGLRKPQP